MMLPLVSVIIPVFNKKDFVEEAVNSVLNQTYDNLEILLIDDGSIDGSTKILKNLALRYPSKIKLIQQTNKGACHARNIGIQESKGDYIQFLDSDDVLDTQKIKSQVEKLNWQPKDVIIFGRWEYFDHQIGDLAAEESPFYREYPKPFELLVELWTSQQMIASFSWLVPREILIKSGKWDESLCLNQDGDFFSRVILASGLLKYDKSAKGYYRKPKKNNISIRKDQEASKSLYKTFENYQNNIFKVDQGKKVKRGLIKNYEHFIYRMNAISPELCCQAFEKIKALFGKKRPYGFFDSKLLFFAQYIGLASAIHAKLKLGRVFK
ncbi:glycosyltransferase family 2 protein [Litoribacter alkaliphilus]|uniref:Glycosyltransferase family 2 protein n=1 Tax=Litoribacter ruber TaxID=702568 RepID=A0AAP2CPM4_9BACT|nr:glycosyltransferase family 2 protein [Litoribacter alkaliphilus]MBS9525597.1 glycosyltransferase family 2 protein [Litoribacter alkaliphilus]